MVGDCSRLLASQSASLPSPITYELPDVFNWMSLLKVASVDSAVCNKSPDDTGRKELVHKTAVRPHGQRAA